MKQTWCVCMWGYGWIRVWLRACVFVMVAPLLFRWTSESLKTARLGIQSTLIFLSRSRRTPEIRSQPHMSFEFSGWTSSPPGSLHLFLELQSSSCLTLLLFLSVSWCVCTAQVMPGSKPDERLQNIDESCTNACEMHVNSGCKSLCGHSGSTASLWLETGAKCHINGVK